MAKSKVMHGARAVLWVGSTALGIFNNVSYGVMYDVSPVYILGKTAAAELVYVGAEVVQVTATGFRVLDHGPFATVDNATGSALVPKLQDLLRYNDIVLSLHDRLETDPNKSAIMTLTNVKPVGFNSSVGARGLQDLTVTFQGIYYSDESGANNEDPSATDLPTSPDQA